MMEIVKIKYEYESSARITDRDALYFGSRRVILKEETLKGEVDGVLLYNGKLQIVHSAYSAQGGGYVKLKVFVNEKELPEFPIIKWAKRGVVSIRKKYKIELL